MQFLSAAKVAAKLDVSVRQVYRLVEWGHLPQPARVGDLPRWLERDIEEYMLRARLGALPDPPARPKRGKADSGGGK